MPREVYFDPYGSYVKGHNLGTQTEMALQKGVREARNTDWDYYNMNPLRLNTAIRDDAVGVAAQPYRLQMPKVLYDNTIAQSLRERMGNYAWATEMGMPEPQANVLRDLAGYNYTVNPQGQYQFTSPGGQISPNLGLEDFLRANPAFRKEGYDRSDTGFNQELQGEQLYNDSIRANAYDYSVQAQADAQRQAAETARAAAYAKATGGAPGALDNSWVIAPGTKNHALFFGGTPIATAPPQPNTPYYAVPGQPLPGVGAPLPVDPANPYSAPMTTAPQTVDPYAPPAQTRTPDQVLADLYTRYPNAPRYTAEQLLAMPPAEQNAYMRTYMPGAIPQ